jgi:hypothetical protein
MAWGAAVVAVLWRRRWGVARLAVAAAALWFLLADAESRLARRYLASLPEVDYAAEVRRLREAGRYTEALTVADAGLETARGEARAVLERERSRTESERASLLRRARDVGLGALTGRGESLEGLIGAVGADMLVVGDVRDLVVEGARLALDGETDEVVLVLSAVGLATTLAPQVDWAPALLKVARKCGSMTAGLAGHVRALARGRRVEELRELLGWTAALARGSSPAQAVRLLRFADGPEDVRALARFVEREKAGAFALHVTGKEGADLVKAAAGAGSAEAGALVVSAARRGPAGAAFLRSPAAGLVLRPHPLVGLAKGVWKGNAQRLVARALGAADGRAWWLIPLCAAWVLVEGAMIAGAVRRVAGGRHGRGAPGVAAARPGTA